MLGSWPSVDPHNFSQFKPNDPTNPSVCTLFLHHNCRFCCVSAPPNFPLEEFFRDFAVLSLADDFVKLKGFGILVGNFWCDLELGLKIAKLLDMIAAEMMNLCFLEMGSVDFVVYWKLSNFLAMVDPYISSHLSMCYHILFQVDVRIPVCDFFCLVQVVGCVLGFTYWTPFGKSQILLS